ncbi:MAG: pyridoxal phosphate-dependent aminotransferase [Gammaproteobacteria bacterium]|nr:pyridoxal phosphate-dependent aminotransferase [Gammaproteobacteria bacterium]
MEPSVIKDMAVRAAHTPDAVSLAWGVPSFATPAPIRAAVSEALDQDPDIGRYSLPDGIVELRAAIAARHHEATGVLVDPDRQVLVTAGNMQAMSTMLKVLLEAGDEVIVTDPGFCSHVQQIELAGGVPRYWRLDEARHWQLDMDALPALVNRRTRAVILVNPSNPTGRIFARDDLLALAALARRHDFLILLDDPYSDFVHDRSTPLFNLSSEPEWGDRVVYMFTFSKAYAMTGWRLGYMVLPEELKREAVKVHDAELICAPRVSQVAGLAALRLGQAHRQECARVIAARRDQICARLDAMHELFAYCRPQGAYYVFPRIVASHHDSREFALRLLAEAGVAVTPGAGFGPAGEHHVRMAFCVSEQDIDRAFDRLDAWRRRHRGM